MPFYTYSNFYDQDMNDYAHGNLVAPSEESFVYYSSLIEFSITNNLSLLNEISDQFIFNQLVAYNDDVNIASCFKYFRSKENSSQLVSDLFYSAINNTEQFVYLSGLIESFIEYSQYNLDKTKHISFKFFDIFDKTQNVLKQDYDSYINLINFVSTNYDLNDSHNNYIFHQISKSNEFSKYYFDKIIVDENTKNCFLGLINNKTKLKSFKELPPYIKKIILNRNIKDESMEVDMSFSL